MSVINFFYIILNPKMCVGYIKHWVIIKYRINSKSVYNQVTAMCYDFAYYTLLEFYGNHKIVLLSLL